ncbi:MAG: DUF72 domain-containing protein [Wenzhouxiangellaceae bacterium]
MSSLEQGNRFGLPYHLGLPAWAFAGWKGAFFPSNITPLKAYSGIFNTVEGNTTFYQIPDAKMVQGWLQAVKDSDFRFSFKLPRSVTHERQPAWDDLEGFLNSIKPLRPYLGPFLLQFPDRVGPDQLSMISAIVERLPQHAQHVVEVRHPAFFQQPERLEPLLQRYELGRVSMDTRALYQGDRQHPEVLAALHKKPDLPVLTHVYNDLLYVRLILHPDRRDNQRYIDEWAQHVAAALNRGQTCYVMIHCPNNQYCPDLALEFHRSLMTRIAPSGLPQLAPWPVPQQASLI